MMLLKFLILQILKVFCIYRIYPNNCIIAVQHYSANLNKNKMQKLFFEPHNSLFFCSTLWFKFEEIVVLSCDNAILLDVL